MYLDRSKLFIPQTWEGVNPRGLADRFRLAVGAKPTEAHPVRRTTAVTLRLGESCRSRLARQQQVDRDFLNADQYLAAAPPRVDCPHSHPLLVVHNAKCVKLSRSGRSFRRRGSRTAGAIGMEASPPPICCAGPAKSTRVWFNVILKDQSRRLRNWTSICCLIVEAQGRGCKPRCDARAALQSRQPDLREGGIYRDAAKAV
jgi:hypothetical protein